MYQVFLRSRYRSCTNCGDMHYDEVLMLILIWSIVVVVVVVCCCCILLQLALMLALFASINWCKYIIYNTRFISTCVGGEGVVVEEGQSIWSKRRQGFQPCFEAGIRELPFLMPEPAEKPSLYRIIFINLMHCSRCKCLSD